MKFSKNCQKLKGDASSRIFYRKKIKKKSSIIVYSKKNKKTNLLNYDSVNKILLKNKILAPMLLSKNYSKNFIEIEDFGNQTILKLFKKKKINKIKIYMQIIYLLNKLQSIRQIRIKNFNNKIYTIPIYTLKFFRKRLIYFLNGILKKN